MIDRRILRAFGWISIGLGLLAVAATAAYALFAIMGLAFDQRMDAFFLAIALALLCIGVLLVGYAGSRSISDAARRKTS